MDKHNPNAGGPISRGEAKKMTAAFKAKHPDRLQAYYFGKENFQRLLAVPGMAGINIHSGLDDNGNQVLILDAVDANMNALSTDPSEQGQPCPPFCNPGGANNL